MDYNHRQTEQKWQRFWDDNHTYKPETHTARPKYYVLDMFPYPSGAGLHVGHPLGYIASDIVSRYKRLKGFNVLHPMGFDSFGLPAEQYAIQTGQHPAVTTEQNLTRYIEQLKNIGFSYDWTREVRTSDPGFYKWTQWIFMELFRSWYNKDTDRAEPIETLTDKFATNGTTDVNAVCDDDVPTFTAAEWNAMSTRGVLRDNLKISPDLSGGSRCKLVSGTGYRSGKRRSKRRRFGAGWLSGRAEADAPMDDAHHGLRRPITDGSGHHRLDRIPERTATQLDRQIRRGQCKIPNSLETMPWWRRCFIAFILH
jgi:hypothetical protein